jgi:hypothetical protein
MDNKRIQNYLIGLFLFITGLIFFNGALQPGKALFGTDFFTIYLPFKLFAQEMALKYHDIPLWMPHLFFGMPLIASSSLLYYYPTDLIFMFLPFPLQYTYTADLFIHLLAAFFGMFFFLRQFNIRREAAFFSGLAFAISGFMLSYIYVGHWNNIKAGALIPFIFYFTAKGFDDKKITPFLTAGALMAFQVLATGMQIMAYTYMGVCMLAVYKIWIEGNNKAGRLKSLGLFALTATAIAVYSSLQLIPSVPYTDYSWRGDFSYNDFISWSLHPTEAITLLLPQFFGLMGENYFGRMSLNLTTYYFGITSFLLVPFAFSGRENRKFPLFMAFCSMVFLILSFGGFTPVYRLFYYLPVFRQFRNPSRFLYVFTFFFTALSAAGLGNILSVGPKEKKGMLRILLFTSAAAGIVSLILLAILPQQNLYGMISGLYASIKNAQIQPQVLQAVADGIRQDVLYFILVSASVLAVIYLSLDGKIKQAFIIAIILAGVNLADMHRIDSRFINYVDYSKVVPSLDPVAVTLRQDKDIYRVSDFMFSWAPNRNIYYDIEGLKGIHGLMPAKYIKMEKEGLFNSLPLDGYFNIKYLIMGQDLNIPGLEKVMDSGIKMYKNNLAAARFDFTDRVKKFNSDEEILSYMKSGAYDLKGVLVKEDIGLAPSAAPLSYSIRLKEYSPNSIRMTVEAGKDGVLVVKNSYYPEWKVKVDNKPGKIYNVNYAFMGIPVKQGVHEIDLYYSKTGFYCGLFLTLFGILAYIVVFIRERKKVKGGK